ncbi:ADP-ribosylation factor GTPase-activating protein AGD4-like isoform X1 [Euphorbia lathyris]|uniref:ADP-ribosylation factor GTPase-activating protein AGD4-like isoform X1 n=2 Tax=Euphorbia lathyris TaxID=212925 RepID=UPI0033135BEF
MAAFINLQDSPMFQKEICSLEQIADELSDRCQRLYKGCHRFMASLGEASSADTSFADSLEAFGGGQDDPVSVSIGGPIMTKFIGAFRELATYKEFLRSQVEHVLIDRLVQFMDGDLKNAKESRKRFEKAVHAYDQSREKFVSLKKNTRGDIIEELEEGLQNSKSAFERSRFNLVNAVVNVEAKKKYEFLESISAIMDAHLRFFKLGYDLFSQMEPFIHQVLTYAQQSKELANTEQDKLAKRIQEFRTQAEYESNHASSDTEPSTSVDGLRVVGVSSYRNVEAVMQHTANGEVTTLKQGYLLKRSASSRMDWKRRFFVLDSQGTLFYYRNKGNRPMGFQHRSVSSSEHNSSVFARFRSRQNKASSLSEGNLGCHVIDLHTSTLKIDSDDSDLRLCFRIISPSKSYTLQAESGADRMDWVNKITGVIASLLNFHLLQQPLPRMKHLEHENRSGSPSAVQRLLSHLHSEDDMKVTRADCVSVTLRKIPGNDLCAECSAPDPDWASLNLGVLLCIECSGVHRNLGVHISKVRSLTLDVKVWEPTILNLFHALGNAYCNSIWEAILSVASERADEFSIISSSIAKPCPKDAICRKEKYIQAKYVEKLLVIREPSESGTFSYTSSIWQAVKTNNLRDVYRYIVFSNVKIINTTFDEVVGNELCHYVDATEMKQQYDPADCQRIVDSKDPGSCLQGCSLLHLACHNGNLVMVELLLQFGANVNLRDFHGRTPLHLCISKGDYSLAKFLLGRGASQSVRDGGGLSVLERAMEKGAITDEELFIMLAES